MRRTDTQGGGDLDWYHAGVHRAFYLRSEKEPGNAEELSGKGFDNAKPRDALLKCEEFIQSFYFALIFAELFYRRPCPKVHVYFIS